MPDDAASPLRAGPDRRGWYAYAALSGAVMALVVVGGAVDFSLFEPLIGNRNPIVSALSVLLLGAMLLYWLSTRRGFLILRRRPRAGLGRATALAGLFGLLIIGVELMLSHPADINVPWPESLIFYPVVSVMAEILFHLLPAVVLLALARWSLGPEPPQAVSRLCLVLVALIEPSFQFMVAAGGNPLVGAPHAYDPRLLTYDWFHIAAINLAQMYLFARDDFFSMWLLRLVYYAIWHVAWGAARLQLLF